MKASEKERFINAFLTLCSVFEKNPSDVLTAAYYRALEKHDIHDVERSISRAIVECKFFPKPVELMELISGKVTDIAEVEAGKVLLAIKYHGGGQSVVFDNATTQAVIVFGLGGWVKMCADLKAADEKWFLKDFVRIYQAYANQGVMHYGHLPGRIEMENSASGYLESIQHPIAIGDLEKAKCIQRRNRKEIANDKIVFLAEKIGQKLQHA